jgi:Asp-tRNA(Asn)/Glu-tRNA(Gln) amidotransferase A subunit family amidase
MPFLLALEAEALHLALEAAVARVEQRNPTINAVVNRMYDQAKAAIASGMVPMAYGNDGGGSIRIPASCCGLFGLKPTRARTPVGPDLGEWWSGLAIAHAITRSVRDSAALLDATYGAEIGDPYWAPPQKRPYQDEVGADPGRLRIAFTSPFNVSGNPAMSVPLHWSPEGLPIGVQFVAPFGDEAMLFRLAAQLETAQPWANRRPAQTF